MNSQLLTAQDLRAGAQSPLDRLARRTGLALVRWSSRRSDRLELGSERAQVLRTAAVLRTGSRNDTERFVLLERGVL